MDNITTYLGGESVVGGKLKESGTFHFNTPNTGVTNETGFTALPSGMRYNSGTIGIFKEFGSYGNWWSTTEHSLTDADVFGTSYMFNYVYSIIESVRSQQQRHTYSAIIPFQMKHPGKEELHCYPALKNNTVCFRPEQEKHPPIQL